jgi:hypothetical protein
MPHPEEFVAERDEVSGPEVLIGCLEKQTAQWTNTDLARVGGVLTAFGWTRKQVRVDRGRGGRREWRFRRGDVVVAVSPVSPAAAEW